MALGDHLAGALGADDPAAADIGLEQLVEILDRIRLGRGTKADLALMRRTSKHIIELSLCGLGQVMQIGARVPGASGASTLSVHWLFSELVDAAIQVEAPG